MRGFAGLVGTRRVARCTATASHWIADPHEEGVMTATNQQLELRGLHHLAPVSSDDGAHEPAPAVIPA